MNMSNEPYNYSELLGRIKAKKLTQEELARIIKLNPSTLNLKLNNKSEFSQSEIRNICNAMDIPYSEIATYFFAI